MTPRERTFAAIQGKPVDRPPAGFWGHDYMREGTAEGLAQAMIGMAQEFGYDFLKVNPRATYYAEAWGCQFEPSNDPSCGPRPLTYIVNTPADLRALRPVSVGAAPFAEALAALRQVRAGLGTLPLFQTLFSPISIVGRLTPDSSALLRWMQDDPQSLHSALNVVTESVTEYARACIDAGADGIFFATTEWASRDAITDDQYDAFARPYDLRVLEGLPDSSTNILHVCRPNNMLLRMLDYPVSVMNWADRAQGNPSLSEVLAKTSKAVMGGIDERNTLLGGSSDDVRTQAADALAQTGGKRFLLAAGCSIDPAVPEANIRAALSAVTS